MTEANKLKRMKRQRRHARVRSRISGTSKIPRLCVFRANRHIYAQVIDDLEGKTLASASSQDLTQKDKKVSLASEVGKLVAKKALEKKITHVVFDRGGYAYHGRIKALAEGAREGGLQF